MCVVKGEEHVRVASPIYKKNLYVNTVEKHGLKQEDSPLNFFDFNVNKYPAAKYVKFLDAKLGAGDCMYIPAFFYI
jgi:hypothetical protein